MQTIGLLQRLADKQKMKKFEKKFRAEDQYLIEAPSGAEGRTEALGIQTDKQTNKEGKMEKIKHPPPPLFSDL